MADFPPDLFSPGEPGEPPTGAEAADLLARTAIIVVNYDSAALLARNLAEVAQRSPEARIVVVDNHSSPEARERARALAQARGWALECPESNTGFGGGMNLGAARAIADGAQVLVLLNPDAVVDRESLVALARQAQADPLALVGPVIRDSSGAIVSDGHVVCLADGSMRSRRSRRPIPPGGTAPWLSGACLALSASLYQRIGGFDARYFLYWEDVDFSARVLAAGGRLVLERRAAAVHDEGGTHGSSAGQVAKSDTYYYYNARNRLLYAGLRLDAQGRRQWRATAPGAAREIVLRGGKRQLLRSPRPVATALRATLDGLRLARRAARGLLPSQDEPILR
ncbi:glycosyltransferase family 2 protein [Actinomyces marmotae]|uniref:Glycosyltransferase family 2 protein n=1 Tax=Actinomyces marmotae TaxID=2737173 RepID=A0A6M8BA64_9ACTO|nr:glycosyltransferase family 2 protein [Actinomyces marmotae]QKD80311.1 glycosyltransferase family 2 protein [Actinomyces marmotae]